MKKTVSQDIKVFLRLFLPQKNSETVLFYGLFLFYLCISIYIAFTTSVIDHPTIETDLYFSFDNPLIIKYGRTQMKGHPLIMIFFYPFVIIGNLLALFAGLKAKTILFVILSSCLTSMSCVYIYRYIREIIEVETPTAMLFALFFAFFSTNLILSFTPESFSLSAFFLAFTVYYYSSYIKKGLTPSFISSAILANVCLGGVTVTNVVKGIIPMLFLKEKKISILKRIVGVGFIFLGMILAVHTFLYFLDGRNYIIEIIFHRGEFTSNSFSNDSKFWDHIFTKFWGTPMFFSEIVNNTFYARSARRVIRSIDLINYAFWWQYVYMGILTCLIVLSFVRNYKNKFVQMLFLLLLVDVLIHCYFEFGLDWPFIYGGHWVYCIPLLLAWLYKKLNTGLAKAFFVLFSCLFAAMLINNLIRLSEFILIAQDMFPPI